MRNTKDVKIEGKGRDRGKLFRLTEMPALKTEKWATRVFLAMARSGVEVPADLAGAGVAGLIAMGFQALERINYNDLEPLLDEMMACVEIVRNPKTPELAQALLEDDIEEVSTILELRKEVFALHAGFTWADVQSKLKKMDSASQTDSPSTQMSPDQSAPSSQPEKPVS